LPTGAGNMPVSTTFAAMPRRRTEGHSESLTTVEQKTVFGKYRVLCYAFCIWRAMNGKARPAHTATPSRTQLFRAQLSAMQHFPL
jgi:hypothetical protein